MDAAPLDGKSSSVTLQGCLQLAGLCFALLLPFVNKPLHIDDPLYIWTANHILSHPLDFYSFRLNWEGRNEPVSRFFQNPPLTSYLLALLTFLFGSSRIIFHLVFFLFDALAVVGIYLLAGRFCRRPFLVAVLFLLCPAFLVSATTLMCEPLMICFWIWGIYFFVIGLLRSPFYLPAAGFILLLAVVTKFVAICIVPLLILYSFCHSSKSRIKMLAQAGALCLPVLGAIAYELLTARKYGSGAFAGAVIYVSGTHHSVPMPFKVKLLDTFCFLGGCAAACVLLIPMAMRWSVLTSVFLITALAALFMSPPQHPDWQFIIQYGIWLFGGAALFLFATLALASSFRRNQWQDDLFLFAWLVGIFVFTGFINWSINARSMLPVLPPVCLLTVRSLDTVKSLSKLGLTFALTIATVLVLCVTTADYNLATTLQIAGTALSRPITTGNVWFVGHWGFQYYMQQSGAQPIDDRSPQARPGDVLIYPVSNYGGAPRAMDLIRLQHLEIGPARWIATDHPESGAEFYCSYGDGLPFVFASIPPEAFDVLRVTSATSIGESPVQTQK
jgi:4-amino-4-deoxy-L-arabinose transferase-like glycosyltransferase